MLGISIMELEVSISYSLALVPPPTWGLTVWPSTALSRLPVTGKMSASACRSVTSEKL